MKRGISLLWLLAGLFLGGNLPGYAATITLYVSASATGSNNLGTSVTDAFPSLTTALASIQNDSNHYRIVIAPGTYYSSANPASFTLSNFTNPQISIQGDTANANQFPSVTEGEVNLHSPLSLSQAKNITLNSLTFGSYSGPMVNVMGGEDLVFQHCRFVYPSVSGPEGLALDSASSSVTVRDCVFARLNNALLADQSSSVRVENCWIYGCTIGLWLKNSPNSVIANNLIQSNTAYGLYLESGCEKTVVFNNVLASNGNTATAQIYADYTAGAVPHLNADGGVVYTPAWNSANNFFSYSESQVFGKIPGQAAIANQKDWIARMNRDAWGCSLSYHLTVLDAPASAVPVNSADTSLALLWGHGTAGLGGYSAPTGDWFGASRPQHQWDLGPLETSEPVANVFHHFRLEASPADGRQDPGKEFSVQVTAVDSADTLVSAVNLSSLYLFLENGGAQADPLGQISSQDVALTQVSPGLYRIPTLTAASFQIKVARNQTANDASWRTLRIVQWEDWNSTGAIQGGLSGSLGLRWTNLPSSQFIRVLFDQPVLASGVHYTSLTVIARDQNQNLIPSLGGADLTGTFNDATTVFLKAPNPWRETSPGVYQARACSSVTGDKTLTVKLMNVQAADQPVISFLPGLYGLVTDSANASILPGIHLTLKNTAGQSIASADTNSSGAYALLVSPPVAEVYFLRLEDPANGLYSPRDTTVTVQAATAVPLNLQLNRGTALAPDILHHAFPNPARRGQRIGLPYNLPHGGHFRLDVYDLRGRLLINLFDAKSPAGRGELFWYGTNAAGKVLAPGTYLLVLKLDDQVSTQKIVLAP